MRLGFTSRGREPSNKTLYNVYVLRLSLRYKQLVQRKGDLEELEKNVKEQQEKISQEKKTHRDTADRCRLLKEENDRSEKNDFIRSGKKMK